MARPLKDALGHPIGDLYLICNLGSRIGSPDKRGVYICPCQERQPCSARGLSDSDTPVHALRHQRFSSDACVNTGRKAVHSPLPSHQNSRKKNKRRRSSTTIYKAQAGYDETASYTLALVKLEKGASVTAQLSGLGDQPIEIGIPVEIATRRLRQDGDEPGMFVYG